MAVSSTRSARTLPTYWDRFGVRTGGFVSTTPSAAATTTNPPPKPPTERGVCKYNSPPSLLLVSLGLSGELAALLHADKPVSRDSDSEVLLINRIPPSRVQIVLSLCALSTTSTRRRTCKRLQGGAPSSRAVHYRTDSGTFIDGNGFRARLNTNASHTHREKPTRNRTPGNQRSWSLRLRHTRNH